MKDPIVRARSLAKTYGSRGVSYPALRGLDLDVEEGEFVAVMGPSGSGKTTLLNIVASIDRPSSGEVRVAGIDLSSAPERELSRFRRERLGFIFQDFNLLDTLTAFENIALPLAFARTAGGEAGDRVLGVAGRLGIEDILGKFPWELSGGQRQRVAAARALVTRPSLVLADEPTGNLDSKSAMELLGTMAGLNAAGEATILMVTHDGLAASFCGRVVFIRDGAVYSQLRRGDDRREFFDRIMDMLKALEGGTR